MLSSLAARKRYCPLRDTLIEHSWTGLWVGSNCRRSIACTTTLQDPQHILYTQHPSYALILNALDDCLRDGVDVDGWYGEEIGHGRCG